MFKRDIEKEIIELAASYPVVTVTGPRQSGKTTLVRKVFLNKPYVNLEDLDVRDLANADPRRFLGAYPEGAILDEIQRAPDLLSYIQGIVDETELLGMFILTGSHQLELQQAITQSLAGRTALLQLLPLSLSELKNIAPGMTVDEHLLTGFFPRVYKHKLNPTKAYRNYFQTYIDRDLRQLINVKDLNTFERFIKLCAGRIGGIFNYENLSNEVGVSSHTIKHWLSILEASFIIFRLQPYFENFGKRLIKSPKLYFCDVGLAAYLLGIETLEQMNRDPLRGGLFENLVVLELLKTRANQGLDPQLYYYRDSQRNEVDVIYKKGNELVAVEIKSAETFTRDFLKNISAFKKIVGERCEEGYVVYAGKQEQGIRDIQLINYQHAAKIF